MTKRAIFHPGGAPHTRPYSPALAAGPFVLVSGQLGVDPRTGDLAGADVEAQTRQALENVRSLLREAGLEMSAVVKTTVFLTDMDDFPLMNEVYCRFFSDPLPARSTIGVASLARSDYRVEIEAWAVRE